MMESKEVAAVALRRLCCICGITEGDTEADLTHGFCPACEELALIEEPSTADLLTYSMAVATASRDTLEYAGRRFRYLLNAFASPPHAAPARGILNATGRPMKKADEGIPAQEWNRRKFPRLITVDDALWTATHQAAKATGSNASATVRAALRAYGPVRDLLPEEMREEGADDE